MEMVKNSAFLEMSNDEMQTLDGGFVIFGITITLTLGAKIGLAAFGVGTLAGIGWALCD